MNIFIGNLLYEATEGDVKKLFEGFGNVASMKIVMRNGKPGGFGFVEMPDEQQALAAIAALNDKEFMGRVLHVEPARPKKEVKQDNRFRPVKDGRVHPFGQPGRYKGGRRTRSYRERHGLTEYRKRLSRGAGIKTILCVGVKEKSSLNLGRKPRESLSLGRKPEASVNLGVKVVGGCINPGLKTAGNRAAIKDEVKVTERLI